MNRVCLFLATLAAAILLSTPVSAKGPAGLPDYYPADYQKIVDASKAEGELLVYSNMAEYNWAPVIEGFNKLYPWIKVQTLDLSSGEVFERYYAETSTGRQSGDLFATADAIGWMEAVDRGAIMPYASPEDPRLPDWSRPLKGVYTISTDPLVIVYNKQLLPENLRPTGVTDLANKIKQNPQVFRNKVTTYGAHFHAFGYTANWAFANNMGDKVWDVYATIGPATRPERSGGPQTEKITTGEYVAGYFISGITVFPRLDDPQRAKIIGFSFENDGTPLMMRGIAVPQKSVHVNAAKLMLDFVVSHAGQVAFGKGGLVPYRSDVKPGDGVRYTYHSIAGAVGGEQNLVLVNYNPQMTKDHEKFVERWKKLYLGQ